MQKTILVTGSTDGIGLATAKMLLSQGHRVLLHGRNPSKLESVQKSLSAETDESSVEAYVADLSSLDDVEALAKAVAAKHDRLDVLINNAGIYKTPEPIAQNGLDVRFAVNTVAPYLLTIRLLPLIGATGRVVNLSSAAQAPVNTEALDGRVRLGDMDAYSQSKLALTMWSRSLALSLENDGPAIIAVNPGSLLASKMVKEGFGVADASGKYFDNDAGKFASPHPDALDSGKRKQVVGIIETILSKMGVTVQS